MSDELIGGLDEVGRGCLAGPMVVAVTAFVDPVPPVGGLADSKKLTAEKREELSYRILPSCDWFGLGWVEPWEIDDLGMNAAWQLACSRALEGAPPMYLLVDGDTAVGSWALENQDVVVKGDQKEWQISAASIIAKFLRDQEMDYLSDFWPQYLWFKNKGYGTPEHRQGIKEHGPCREHRALFLRKLK